MKKTELTDALLCSAVDEMSCGLVDAELGGGLVKKRIALPGRGKSGSTRTIVATNHGDRWFFLLGFEKNDMDNVETTELKPFRLLAGKLLRCDDTQLKHYILSYRLEEINYD